MVCDLQGAEAVFAYSSSSVLIAVSIGMAFLIVGIAFFKNNLASAYWSGRVMALGVVLCLFAIVTLGVIAPTMFFTERIIFTKQEMCSAHGLWFFQKHDGFFYSEVDHVSKIVEPTRSNNGHTELEIHFKNGVKEYLGRSDLWAENEIQISKLLQTHGVKFSD